MRLETSEFDPNRLDGPDRPVTGGYHFEVIHLVEFDAKTGTMYADCEVLAGDVPGQEGKVHREYFDLKPQSMGKVAQFAVALGLATIDGLRECKAKGIEPELPFETDGIGCQFFGRLVEEVYQGKKRNKLNFNTWSLDDSKAKGIPVNKAKLRHPRGDEPSGTPAAGRGDTNGGNGGSEGASADAPFDADDLF